MKTIIFSIKDFERSYLLQANRMNHELTLLLESGKIRYLGTDVYEKEKGIFFYDYSKNRIHDEMLKKLMSFPNVIVTPHQAFATQEALSNIADTTFYNLDCWAQHKLTENELTGNRYFHPYN